MEIIKNSQIGDLVREAEDNFLRGNIQVSKYVTQDFYEDVNTIEAYLNSKHITGEKDSLGRDKPFFNIVLAARNIWFRATDIDRKHIRAKADKIKDLIASYLLTIHIQDWMKKEDFGKFLNDWGLYLASYNSCVCKFVENKDGLHPMVMDWNKMIVDVIDFDSNPRIEILELTPAQLKKRENYDQEMVEKLIEAVSARESTEGMKKDTKENYIKIYEVHGDLPLSYLTGKEKDEDTYAQQMHIISFVETKGKGEYDDYTLYSGREKKDPYMLTWLIPNTDGSISLNGSVKNLFQAQWMVNHSIKNVKDQLDLASKIILQTSDGQFANKNILDNIQNGQIMVHKENMPLTAAPNNSNDITALMNFGQQWKNLAQEIVSTPDILGGNNMPSGTAFRQAAIIQQEAHSNFEIMTENKGLHIERMFRDYITPYLLKKMDTTEEISATLDTYGIDKIEQMYISNKAVERFNYKMVESVINDTEMPDLGQEQQGVKQELAMQGGQRFIKPSDIETITWKDMLKDFEGSIIYDIVPENTEKQAVMDTLTSVFQTIVGMQGRPMTEQEKFVFNKILNETSALSPIELQEKESNATAPAMVGQGSAVAPEQIAIR